MSIKDKAGLRSEVIAVPLRSLDFIQKQGVMKNFGKEQQDQIEIYLKPLKLKEGRLTIAVIPERDSIVA